MSSIDRRHGHHTLIIHPTPTHLTPHDANMSRHWRHHCSCWIARLLRQTHPVAVTGARHAFRQPTLECLELSFPHLCQLIIQRVISGQLGARHQSQRTNNIIVSSAAVAETGRMWIWAEQATPTVWLAPHPRAEITWQTRWYATCTVAI